MKLSQQVINLVNRVNNEKPISKEDFMDNLDWLLQRCEENTEMVGMAHNLFYMKNKIDYYKDNAIPIKFYYWDEGDEAHYYVVH